MAKPTAKYVMVRSCSPRGSFRRAGLVFTSEWRVLEVSTRAQLDKGIIDEATLKALEAEKQMLAVKPATEAEVEAFQKLQAESTGKDKDALIAELVQKNAELEARLMKLELAAGGKNGDANKQKTQ
jgi:hypothetical protein